MSLRIPPQSRGNITALEYSSINCLGGWLSYAERIRQAHKKWELAHDKELSWAQVARECQRILKRPVDPSTMNRWKTGKQEPTVSEFAALAEVLDATPGELAFGDSAGQRRATAGLPLAEGDERPARGTKGKGKRKGER